MFGKPDNGNFLGLVEVLAKYDSFWKEYTIYIKDCQAKKENNRSLFTSILESEN